MSNQFDSELIQTYSVPTKKSKTKLAYLFEMKLRENKEKAGRQFGIIWDKRMPLVERFENNYTYFVKFKIVGNAAGNHFHYKKQELFYPIIGRFKIILEDIETKEREELIVDARQHQAIYFPIKIAHTIISQTNPAIFLVTASTASEEKDEVSYELI